MDQIDVVLDSKERLNPPLSAQLTDEERRQAKRDLLNAYQATPGQRSPNSGD